MKWRVKIDGGTTTLKAFLAVEKGIIDLRQLGAWKQVAGKFYRIEKRLFDSEGSSGRHGKWSKLTPKYERAKFRKWGAVKILTASGELYKSLTQSGGGSSVYEEHPQELLIGTSLHYARLHQTGTSKMPARRPIDLTDDDEKQITGALKQKIRQLIQNARLRDTRGF